MQLRVIHKTHLTNFDLLLDKAIETLILAMTLTMTKTVLAKTSCKKNCSRCWMDLRHRRWQWTSQSWSASWLPPAGDGHQQRDNKSATYIKYLQKGENTTEVKFAGTMILLLLITTAQRFILGQIESYCQLNIIDIYSLGDGFSCLWWSIASWKRHKVIIIPSLLMLGFGHEGFLLSSSIKRRVFIAAGFLNFSPFFYERLKMLELGSQ